MGEHKSFANKCNISQWNATVLQTNANLLRRMLNLCKRMQSFSVELKILQVNIQSFFREHKSSANKYNVSLGRTKVCLQIFCVPQRNVAFICKNIVVPQTNFTFICKTCLPKIFCVPMRNFAFVFKTFAFHQDTLHLFAQSLRSPINFAFVCKLSFYHEILYSLAKCLHSSKKLYICLLNFCFAQRNGFCLQNLFTQETFHSVATFFAFS